jgi:hypothetical protein
LRVPLEGGVRFERTLVSAEIRTLHLVGAVAGEQVRLALAEYPRHRDSEVVCPLADVHDDIVTRFDPCTPVDQCLRVFVYSCIHSTHWGW